MPEGIQRHVSLDQYTTLHVGGVADFVAEVKNLAELTQALAFAQTHTTSSPLILGGGSNVLISDEGYRGLVIRMCSKGKVVVSETKDEILLTVQAGEPWDELVAYTVTQGWSGLENLSGIPGTVGASPVQNINAYGASVADTIVSVEVFDSIEGVIKNLSHAACQFGYRDSVFKQPAGKGLIVTSVTFRLSPEVSTNLSYRSSSQSIARYLADKQIEIPTLQNIREAILYARRNIGMLEGQFRSAGSFFKNTIVSDEEFAHIEHIVATHYVELGQKMSPWFWKLPSQQVKVSTAFLMECSPFNKETYGIKRFNDVVGLSPKHSLSIVTEPGATATDVVTFAEEIISAVKKIFAVTIEAEVNFISS